MSPSPDRRIRTCVLDVKERFSHRAASVVEQQLAWSEERGDLREAAFWRMVLDDLVASQKAALDDPAVPASGPELPSPASPG